MRATLLITALFTASVFLGHPSMAQMMAGTNSNAPVSEGGRRAFDEFVKLRQRTAQVLAAMDAAAQTNINFLTSRDSCHETMYLLKQQRLLILRPLISVVESTNSWEVRDAAANILGDYRALEAIPCLVSNIQQDTVFKMYSSIVTEDQRKPFGAALASIGEPSVPALLDRIESEVSERVTQRCIEVVVRIIGKERCAALLRDRIKAANDPVTRANLERALSGLARWIQTT